MPSLKPPASVIYLARAAEGTEAIEKFRQSYVDHPAGMEHDLVVCLKGDDDAALQRVKALLAPIATRFVAQKDVGYDIHAYLYTARQVDTEWVCCLNTFSVINRPGWLERMYQAAVRPGVGLVGATASYESRRATFGVWIWYLGRLVGSESMRALTHDQLAYMVAALERGYTVPRIARLGRRLKLWGLEEEPLRLRHFRLWIDQLRNDPPFPGFPNPHVRTTGFMLKADFLTSRFASLGPEKMDCYKFESGPEGLSATVAKEGLEMMVVGDNGAYAVGDWPRSGTFRTGEQEALLISDNQTTAFMEMSPVSREIHSYFTWGDAVIDPGKFEFPPLPSVKNGIGLAPFVGKLARTG